MYIYIYYFSVAHRCTYLYAIFYSIWTSQYRQISVTLNEIYFSPYGVFGKF